MARFHKQLEDLITKALKSGYANKNGRMNHGYGYKGELEPKFTVEYNQESGDLTVSHWGTEILTIGSLKSSNPIVKEFYGQSNSDRDLINHTLERFGMQGNASYKPSQEMLYLTADFGNGTQETREV